MTKTHCPKEAREAGRAYPGNERTKQSKMQKQHENSETTKTPGERKLKLPVSVIEEDNRKENATKPTQTRPGQVGGRTGTMKIPLKMSSTKQPKSYTEPFTHVL